MIKQLNVLRIWPKVKIQVCTIWPFGPGAPVLPWGPGGPAGPTKPGGPCKPAIPFKDEDKPCLKN